MASQSKVTISFFASGFCEAHEKVVNPKKGFGKISFYAVWALIEVPNLGYMLFDTGYSHHFEKATQRFPGKLYRIATPVKLKTEESAVEILKRKGIHHTEIKYILVSHFHADHIAGLKDFPSAKIICSKVAFLQTQQLQGIKAVLKGILHQLIPEDILQRINFIEDLSEETHQNNYGLTEYKWNLIPNLKFLLLPGHAKGMLGFHFANEYTNLLFATDAAWDTDCFNKGIMPLKIVKIFIDSWDELNDTSEKLKAMKNDSPSLEIAFTHCPKTLQLITHAF